MRRQLEKLSNAAQQKSQTMLAAYVVFFGVLFSRVSTGVGQYWDWSFPYFQSQIPQFFSRASESWVRDQSGKPLGYASDYIARFFISQFQFLQPEALLYTLLVLLFSISAFGVFLLARKHYSIGLSWLLGLVVMVNPATFYKFTAGHVNYFLSLAVFIWLLYYLHTVFKHRLKDYFVAAFMLACVGPQIQFFIYGGLYLMIFFAFQAKLVRWRYIWILVALPLLINIVWITNFIDGAASFSETGANAAKVAFKTLSQTQMYNILHFQFSNATLIGRYYGVAELLPYTALLGVSLLVLVFQEKLNKTHLIFLVYLTILMFMATGQFQAINLGPLTAFYPMLREAGHVAPLVILFIVLIIAMSETKQRWLKVALTTIALLSISVSAGKFIIQSQTLDFTDIRKRFTEFYEHSSRTEEEHDQYRVLVYPFFDQYALNGIDTRYSKGLPLNNSGHDSYSAYTSEDIINNTVRPTDFLNSLQYNILTTYDIELLKTYNVRYIYDFSDIYESYFERYVPKSTYSNDISLIKNDHQFLEKLLSKNPGKLRRVSENILEVIDHEQPARILSDSYRLENGTRMSEALRIVRGVTGRGGDLVPIGLPSDRYGYIGQLFGQISEEIPNDAQRSELENRVIVPDNGTTNSLVEDTTKSEIMYTYARGLLTIYTEPPGSLNINGKIYVASVKSRAILMQQTIATQNSYVLEMGGVTVPLTETVNPKRLGTAIPDQEISIYAVSGNNLVDNPSFEAGAWETAVRDCNKYDDRGDIDMYVVADKVTNGTKALELSTAKHNACTSQQISLNTSSKYVLEYDYSGEGADRAAFYLDYGADAEASRGQQSITIDKRWRRLTKIISTPEKLRGSRLYLYAIEPSAGRSKVYYDNVVIRPLALIASTKLKPHEDSYQKIGEIPTGEVRVKYSDPEYDFTNMLPNGNFENGLWRSEVADCSSYDNNPDIDMTTGTGTSGSRSLKLSATRHVACTYTSVDIEPNRSYQISVKYRAKKDVVAGINVSYDAPANAEIGWQQPAATDDWQIITKTITAPKEANILTLHLYAFESDKKTQNTVEYDDISITAIPAAAERFSIINQYPTTQSGEVAKYHASGQTSRQIQIKTISKSFTLELSTSYHPMWRMTVVRGIQKQTIPDDQHFKLNDFANGWYIDVDKLCKQQNLCHANPDGTYDLELVAEFTPQRWFYVGLIISGLTLAGCLGYLGLTGWRHWRRRRGSGGTRPKSQGGASPRASKPARRIVRL